MATNEVISMLIITFCSDYFSFNATQQRVIFSRLTTGSGLTTILSEVVFHIYFFSSVESSDHCKWSDDYRTYFSFNATQQQVLL